MSRPQRASRRKAGNANVEVKLQKELERLKNRLNIGHELRVVWAPTPNSKLSGEVKNATIYVYEQEENKAVEVLKHEFIDYLVSQAIEPYKSVANKLIQLLNEIAYKRKEEIVENLAKLLG